MPPLLISLNQRPSYIPILFLWGEAFSSTCTPVVTLVKAVEREIREKRTHETEYIARVKIGILKSLVLIESSDAPFVSLIHNPEQALIEGAHDELSENLW
ncbi:unnamed protein product [Camellia sinensis]